MSAQYAKVCDYICMSACACTVYVYELHVTMCERMCNCVCVCVCVCACACVCGVVLLLCLSQSKYIIAHKYKMQHLFSSQPDILLSKYIHHFLLIMLIHRYFNWQGMFISLVVNAKKR